MSSTRPARDPIVQDSSGSKGSGSMGHPSADRVKSLPSKGPNFTKGGDGNSAPVPNSPYGNGE